MLHFARALRARMRRLALLTVFLISASAAGAPAAGSPAAGTPAAMAMSPIEYYAGLPGFTDLEISPGGNYLAARVNIGGAYRLVIFDISGPGANMVYAVAEDNEFAAQWFSWATPERLIVSIDFAGRRGGLTRVDTTERRLFSLSVPDKEFIPLFRTKRDENPVQIQDRVISFLRDDPDHILVQYPRSDPTRPMIYRINITKTTRHRKVMAGENDILSWQADRSGQVRLGWGVDRAGKEKLIMRVSEDDRWEDFSHRVRETGVQFDPVGFANQPHIVYVISNHESDPAGLYTFDMQTDSFGERIFQHERVDISSVGIDDETGEIVSINFVDTELETVWLGKRNINVAIGELQQRFPDRKLSTYSISADGQHAVLRQSADGDAGRFLLYNHVTGKLKGLPGQYPELTADKLGSVFATEYTARDGLTIPAFVTLPPGIATLDEARGLPFVVHPHGGPAARDFRRFSFDVQFLVSRGYGVLQMNFRGSSGYGQEFKAAGDRQWGQAMQDDITDGTQWLVAQGYADPERIAIVGGSYGGYAALMGAVKTPDLYQCAVSFAGVTDLPSLIKRERNYVGGKYATRFIGDLWRDRKMLAENSPARRGEDIRIPVLLMHGEKDLVVDIDQSEKMARELDRHNVPHEFIRFADGDHFLSLYPNRLRYLQETERFLGDCLSPEQVGAASGK